MVFCMIAIADWLSIRKWVSPVHSKPRSANKVHSHISSFVACTLVIYSASVLDRAVDPCFFELQLIAPLASLNT